MKVDYYAEPVFGTVLRGPITIVTHEPEKCDGTVCAVHNPSKHHMRRWPKLWRSDKVMLERLCPHGVGHPDPDGAAYDIAAGNAWKTTHGCDGCCEPD